MKLCNPGDKVTVRIICDGGDWPWDNIRVIFKLQAPGDSWYFVGPNGEDLVISQGCVIEKLPQQNEEAK